MQKEKISTIEDWKELKNIKENFSKIANPLTELTKKDATFEWNDKAQEAFNQLKQAILSEPVLAMFDPEKEIELETDASDFTLGGQIGQQDD
ncbi:reverse transcriptase domain [Fusarium acutatum]|uniref:Reverse transcriptase domain n=1 Tax=Fusarium acutatum TaxID=78861 RepID=A0A8H4JCQ9_9HYPO|nr:reverse transcriptase domain [Fusarium acutatum]